MHRGFLWIGALLAALSVALGAFGAHGLERMTNDTAIIKSYQTGVQYQFYHAFALLITGILYEKFPGLFLRLGGLLFGLGILLFSGSLYLLTFMKIRDWGNTSFVGPITPLGGLLFIAGWVLVLIAVLRRS